MAATITEILDGLGNDVTGGACYEDLADGNLSITISVDDSLDSTSIENFNGYIDGSLTDNEDGTFTFEVDKDSALGEPCLTITEFVPQDCETVCPIVSLFQTISGGSYSTDFQIDSEFEFSSIIINGASQVSEGGTIGDVVAGDCITYSFVLELTGENESVCTFNFDITLPACTTNALVADCTTIDLCTVNTPTLSYACGENGLITVTEDAGEEAAISYEELSWSPDGILYASFVDSFTTTVQSGYIKYVVKYDDGCEEQEVIIEFNCVIDCDGEFDYICQYIEGTNEFVATFTDTNTTPILTDVIEYFVDGGLVGISYTSGTLIDGTGINRIDFRRTIVFDAPCDNVVQDFYCAKVDENCDYTGYSLTSVYDAMSDSVVPTFSGDESILLVSEKSYSVDGANYDPWLGGAVPTNLFATFVWKIQILGCEPVCRVTTAARAELDINITNNNDNPIVIDIDNTNPIDIEIINENPIEIDITNENPIDINIQNENPIAIDVKNVVEVNQNCCPPNCGCSDCTDGGGDTTVQCPGPTIIEGDSNVVEQTNIVYGTTGTYFTTEPKIDYQTDGRVFVLGGNGEQITRDQVWSDNNSDDGQFVLRLNKSGIWSDNDAEQQVVFGFCVDIQYTGIHSIGFAADNEGVIKIDGDEAIRITTGGTPTDEQTAHKIWYVVERNLTAGKHLIQIEAEQGASGLDIAVGFEIYNKTTAQLKNMITTAQVDAAVVASSRSLVQTNDLGLVFGVPGGLECPTGTTPGFDGCNPVCICDDDYTNIPDGVSTTYSRDGNDLTAEMTGCTGTESYKWEVDWGDGNGWVTFDTAQVITPTQAGLYRPVGICDAVDVPGDPIYFNGFWQL